MAQEQICLQVVACDLSALHVVVTCMLLENSTGKVIYKSAASAYFGHVPRIMNVQVQIGFNAAGYGCGRALFCSQPVKL